MEKEIKAFEKYLGRKLGLGNKALIESFIEFRALNSEVSEAHSERSEANEGENHHKTVITVETKEHGKDIECGNCGRRL